MKSIVSRMNWVIALIITLVFIANTEAVMDNRKVGVGFSLGAPSGLNGKIWLSKKNALNIDLGWGYSNYWIKADYVWHDWRAIKETEDLLIPVYYGIGGFAGGLKDEMGFGPEAVLGLNFIFKHSPFDLFIEAGPSLQLIKSPGMFIHASFGVRYFFPKN